MKRIAILVAGMLLLTGCAEKQLGDMSYPEQTALLKQIFDRCAKEAPPPGSPQNKYCFSLYVQQEQHRRQQSAINAANFRAGVADAAAISATNMGNSYNAAAARPVYVPAPLAPSRCISTVGPSYTSGTPVTTSCY